MRSVLLKETDRIYVEPYRGVKYSSRNIVSEILPEYLLDVLGEL